MIGFGGLVPKHVLVAQCLTSFGHAFLCLSDVTCMEVQPAGFFCHLFQ